MPENNMPTPQYCNNLHTSSTSHEQAACKSFSGSSSFPKSAHEWNEAWKAAQKLRRAPDNSLYWNSRARTFSTKDAPSPYVKRFLELAAIFPDEVVFDMGCGTGSLAIPLAKANNRIIAADFSEGMLEVLRTAMREQGITNIETKQMSWEDNWEAHGVSAGGADVCIASRSIAVADLQAALLKLDEVAKRRVCLTLIAGASAHANEKMLHDLGLKKHFTSDYIYAFSILESLGKRPELTFIESKRKDSFDSRDSALEAFLKMVEKTAPYTTNEERKRAQANLDDWISENVIENPRAGMLDCKGVPEHAFTLREDRIVTWAFIAWNK